MYENISIAKRFKMWSLQAERVGALLALLPRQVYLASVYFSFRFIICKLKTISAPDAVYLKLIEKNIKCKL